MDNKLQDEQVTMDNNKQNVEQVQIDPIVVELEEMRTKYLRLSADFDNYRKRTIKEKEDIFKYSSQTVLKDFLDIIDDFDIAMKNIENTTDINSIKDGISLISNKFNTFLKSKDITQIDDIGQDFNTDLHDAITKIPVENIELKGKVVDVIKKGYMIHDKVMRHSKVIIGD